MRRATASLLGTSFPCHVPVEPDSFEPVSTVPATAASKLCAIEASAQGVAVTAPKAAKGR